MSGESRGKGGGELGLAYALMKVQNSTLDYDKIVSRLFAPRPHHSDRPLTSTVSHTLKKRFH